MNEESIIVYGEQPDEGPNPSTCPAFLKKYPTLFAPLQTEAFKGVREGRSLALVAPTSSGKTMAIAAPIFDARKKAVFVYPFRVLVLDQTNQLVRYGKIFGVNEDNFAQIMGGDPDRELANAIEKPYILMTPDKLVSLFLGGRVPKGAVLTLLTNYIFVFDEIHAYNTLMRESLVYFIRSSRYWREGINGTKPAFYFLSATFPEDLWPILKRELEMNDNDRIEGKSMTGNVTLLLRPGKGNTKEIADEISSLGMNTNVVCIFNTAIKAWRVAQQLWGQDIAKRRLFIGQDKMSERERLENFLNFTSDPKSSGLCGSPAIEASVDFPAANLVIEETYMDSFLQRLGRAARSGQDALVLCYSSTLFAMKQRGQLHSEYTRRDFLNLIHQVMHLREPRKMFKGLAAYPYYKFWDKPDFINGESLELCETLDKKAVKPLLAFRGFTPYAEYQSGERISYKTLFRRDLRMEKGKVIGGPSLERYFFSKQRPPVDANLNPKNVACKDKIDEDTTVLLADINFEGFGSHWVLLEIKSEDYEHSHPNEQDDNICLHIQGKLVGRTSKTNVRNGLVRFFEVDA
jgi:CRISPR/Cas system-associated endonuclease/helicase Cas3